MNLHYEKKLAVTDTNFKPSKVEKAGYVSAQKQIEALIYSGRRLEAVRKGEFDFNGGDILEENDITSLRDIDDLADFPEFLRRHTEERHSGDRIPGEVPGSDDKGNNNGVKELVVDPDEGK